MLSQLELDINTQIDLETTLRRNTAMRQPFLNAVFLSCATASALQIPFLESLSPQNAVITKKPLVSSEAIQADISSKALLKRAKELFKIAELGEDEYNHPTRVIGSKGLLHPPLHPSHLPIYSPLN